MKRLRKVLSLLLSLAMLLGIVGGLGISTYADENYNEINELVNQIFDAVPDSMYLDIPEAEFEKAPEMIEKNIEVILSENGFDFNRANELSVSYNSSGVIYNFDIYNEEFYVSVYDEENDSYSNFGSKGIKLVYSNTDKYNSADAEYVKNLEINPSRFIEIPFNEYKNNDSWKLFRKFSDRYFEEYCRNILNDPTITIIARAYAGAGDPSINWGECERTTMSIFKNGICYDIRKIANREAIPVITVPYNISDDELTDYALNMIKKEYRDDKYLQIITGIEKGFVDYNNKKSDYTDGYTFYSEYQDEIFNNHIVIHKELPPADEAIIEDGTETEYTIGSDKGVSIHCSYPLEEFISVSVNGKTVDKSNYSLADGSTVLTFKPSYLNTLKAGNYAVELHYTIGTVETVLNIKEANSQTPNKPDETQQKPQASSQGQKETAKSPSTGNDSGMTIAISFAAFSACGMAYAVLKKKKAVL